MMRSLDAPPVSSRVDGLPKQEDQNEEKIKKNWGNYKKKIKEKKEKIWNILPSSRRSKILPAILL